MIAQHAAAVLWMIWLFEECGLTQQRDELLVDLRLAHVQHDKLTQHVRLAYNVSSDHVEFVLASKVLVEHLTEGWKVERPFFAGVEEQRVDLVLQVSERRASDEGTLDHLVVLSALILDVLGWHSALLDLLEVRPSAHHLTLHALQLRRKLTGRSC